MIHKMKLQAKYFDFMFRGTKRIEIRLNDEKRQLIKIGDIIEFERFSELNDSFKTRVVELIRYNNFDELVKHFDISILADKSMTKSELINELIQFYSEEKQQKYGVLAIRIELMWLYKKDGKRYKTDCANRETIFRLIQSIPSPNAEPFMLWFAKLAEERILETIDPSMAVERARKTYLKKGYTDEWVNARIKGIPVRNELTYEWKKSRRYG